MTRLLPPDVKTLRRLRRERMRLVQTQESASQCRHGDTWLGKCLDCGHDTYALEEWDTDNLAELHRLAATTKGKTNGIR